MSRSKKIRCGTWRRLHPSPLAVALDGSMLASVGLYDGVEDAGAAIRAAVEHGGRVFIGVELAEDQVTEVKRWLDEASFECLAFILGAKPRRRKRRGSAR